MINKPISVENQINIHSITEKPTRNRCAKYYKEMVEQGSRSRAQKVTKKIKTFCSGYEKYYCIECYFIDHKYQKLIN